MVAAMIYAPFRRAFIFYGRGRCAGVVGRVMGETIEEARHVMWRNCPHFDVETVVDSALVEREVVT